MILGLSVSAFTILQIIVNLIAVASGLVVPHGVIKGPRMPALTHFSLAAA